MTKALTRAGKTLALKSVIGQLIAVALLALIAVLSFNGNVTIAIICGGLSAIIPNALFGAIAFMYAGARANQKVVKSFFLGEGVKILLTALLLSMLFLVTNLAPLWLMSGFITAVFAQWLVPILSLKST